MRVRPGDARCWRAAAAGAGAQHGAIRSAFCGAAFSPAFLGEDVDLYIPRKCSWTNRLITATDHASIQINIGHLDDSGLYTGQFTTIALSGFVRSMVRTCRSRPGGRCQALRARVRAAGSRQGSRGACSAQAV